jgi:hypothetical protein
MPNSLIISQLGYPPASERKIDQGGKGIFGRRKVLIGNEFWLPTSLRAVFRGVLTLGSGGFGRKSGWEAGATMRLGLLVYIVICMPIIQPVYQHIVICNLINPLVYRCLFISTSLYTYKPICISLYASL